jgi:tetratricopeptide (TPR) repeat protein
VIIISLLFSLLLNPFASQANAQFALRGYVRNSTGQGVGNVRVSLLDENRQSLKTIFSDTTGQYEFRGVGRGVYYLRVDLIGTIYENAEQRIELVTLSSSTVEEPVMVDLMVRPKRNPANGAAPATSFSQSVPEEAQKEYKRGLESSKANKAESAIASFKKAIELFPDYYDALEQLGNLYVEQRDYSSAHPLLHHAVEINKDGWRAHYGLGVAQFNLKEREAAINSLKRAIELNAGSANAYMWLGVILAQQSDTRLEAIHAFETVIQLAKDQIPDVYFYLGSLYSKNNQSQEAADALEHFLRLSPQAGDREKLKQVIEQLRQKAAKNKPAQRQTKP